MTISEAWNEYYLNGYHGERQITTVTARQGGYTRQQRRRCIRLCYRIQYTSNKGKHIFGLPTNVVVTGGDGTMYHNVSATYDTKYPKPSHQGFTAAWQRTAVTDYKYDRYGNITQKTLPANATGQRMWYTSTATSRR